MGLAVRIIPTILYRGRTMVKGAQFNAWRSVGMAMQAARIHGARGVDELVILDIGATPEGRGPDLKMVEELSADLFCPLAVGGGVKSVADVRALLKAGADKVVIGSGLLHPCLLDDVASAVGSQAVVVAIDYKDHEVYIECGKTNTHWAPWRAAKRAQTHGAGEIILTDMGREGTMGGYDLTVLGMVSEGLSIPVIAHGGCGTPQHMLEAVRAGASAVAAGSMFLFKDVVPLDCARFLVANGVEARVEQRAA